MSNSMIFPSSYHFVAEVLSEGKIIATIDGIVQRIFETYDDYAEFKNKLKTQFRIKESDQLIIRTLNKL